MIAAVPYVLALLWLWHSKRFLWYMLFFPLFAWTYRLVDVLYLDAWGPVYAIELYRDVGGGGAAPWLVASLLIVLAAFGFIFRRSEIESLASIVPDRSENHIRSAANVVFIVLWAFIASLYLDMLSNGFLPVAVGMERWVYTEQFAGATHQFLHKYGMHLSFYLGLFYWYPLLRGRGPDNRYLVALLIILLYLFLAGHRFSAFYSHGSFFIMCGAVPALKRMAGRLPSLQAMPRRVFSRLLQIGAVVAVCVIVAAALYRSYTFTRFIGMDAAMFGFQQRVLVQQGEMFVATYERVIEKGEYDPARTYHKLWVEPVGLEGRNSTMPYLMELELGEEAHPIIAQGVSYAGGFPEIWFELLGRYGAFAGIGVLALALALMVRLVLRLILQERLLSVFFAFYVMYPFILAITSGMLNFLYWKYYLNLAALGIWLLFESGRQLQARVLAESRG